MTRETNPSESIIVGLPLEKHCSSPNIKLALSQSLKARRQKVMTQVELAEKIYSSQPRVAKAENGDASVSIELLIRAMLATGATLQEIGKVIAEAG
ncbi:helix-turn-helix domain-containing protein [Nostoc sp.]|uniref:helix-turn-helix domain-containing protein n=1 Tax=Nostoc sp. TaxID=1180 RepID=UPI002FF492E8